MAIRKKTYKLKAMKNQTSSLPKPIAIPAIDTNSFGRVFLIKDDKLTPEPDISEKANPLLVPFKSGQELNKIILTNRAVMFGKETVGLTANIGRVIFPFDAFLFDFSNRDDPRCFLLLTPKILTESMMALITIRSYLETRENRTVLIKMLSEYIGQNKASQKAFKPFVVKGQTIEAMLEYVIRKRLRALFLANEVEPDNIKMFTSFIEAHSELLDIIELRKYKVGKTNLLSMLPALADLKEKQEVKVIAPKEKIIHTEENHLEKSSELVRAIYKKLKAEAIKIDKSMVFNPKGKHYVSMKKGTGNNLAFFHFRKSSMYLVVKLDEKIVRKLVKKNAIQSLPASVQKFWNGASTGLIISSANYLKEIIEVLKKLIK
jgi:hypothetical protein